MITQRSSRPHAAIESSITDPSRADRLQTARKKSSLISLSSTVIVAVVDVTSLQLTIYAYNSYKRIKIPMTRASERRIRVCDDIADTASHTSECLTFYTWCARGPLFPGIYIIRAKGRIYIISPMRARPIVMRCARAHHFAAVINDNKRIWLRYDAHARGVKPAHVI